MSLVEVWGRYGCGLGGGMRGAATCGYAVGGGVYLLGKAFLYSVYPTSL